jgi:hypothetical protein
MVFYLMRITGAFKLISVGYFVKRASCFMYRENDKIMVLTTGEVLTVAADFTEHLERGIMVKEDVGRSLTASEVRPAGRTRERADAGKGVVEPDPFPPPVDDLL